MHQLKNMLQSTQFKLTVIWWC